jgi:DNA-binding FrmR family transcriptional regulator|tara:strand:- start:865 stop:1128 length:264 start_codon:yes stop_codon:yes gene_type:complete
MKNHPSHQSQLSALRRVEGQVRGIIKMIDEGKYCIDVLNQIKAAKAALVRVESNVLKKHVESCVKASFKNKEAIDSKVEELLKLINK